MKRKAYINNKPFQKQKPTNPILKQQEIERKIKNRMFEARDAGVEYGRISSILIMMHILIKDTNIKTDEVQDAINKMMRMMDKSEELKTIPEIISYMRTNGYHLTDETIVELYPAIEGYLDPEEP